MEKNKFKYTYSAPTKSEREQIEDIRRDYLQKSEQETKLETLKKLDSKVKNIPTLWGLSVGIIGTLIFGLGLTMILEWNIIVWGVLVSAIGLVPVALAYPVFKKIKTKTTNKYKDEILNISNELLNLNNEKNHE